MSLLQQNASAAAAAAAAAASSSAKVCSKHPQGRVVGVCSSCVAQKLASLIHTSPESGNGLSFLGSQASYLPRSLSPPLEELSAEVSPVPVPPEEHFQTINVEEVSLSESSLQPTESKDFKEPLHLLQSPRKPLDCRRSKSLSVLGADIFSHVEGTSNPATAPAASLAPRKVTLRALFQLDDAAKQGNGATVDTDISGTDDVSVRKQVRRDLPCACFDSVKQVHDEKGADEQQSSRCCISSSPSLSSSICPSVPDKIKQSVQLKTLLSRRTRDGKSAGRGERNMGTSQLHARAMENDVFVRATYIASEARAQSMRRSKNKLESCGGRSSFSSSEPASPLSVSHVDSRSERKFNHAARALALGFSPSFHRSILGQEDASMDFPTMDFDSPHDVALGKSSRLEREAKDAVAERAADPSLSSPQNVHIEVHETISSNKMEDEQCSKGKGTHSELFSTASTSAMLTWVISNGTDTATRRGRNALESALIEACQDVVESHRKIERRFCGDEKSGVITTTPTTESFCATAIGRCSGGWEEEYSEYFAGGAEKLPLAEASPKVSAINVAMSVICGGAEMEILNDRSPLESALIEACQIVVDSQRKMEKWSCGDGQRGVMTTTPTMEVSCTTADGKSSAVESPCADHWTVADDDGANASREWQTGRHDGLVELEERRSRTESVGRVEGRQGETASLCTEDEQLRRTTYDWTDVEGTDLMMATQDALESQSTAGRGKVEDGSMNGAEKGDGQTEAGVMEDGGRTRQPGGEAKWEDEECIRLQTEASLDGRSAQLERAADGAEAGGAALGDALSCGEGSTESTTAAPAPRTAGVQMWERYCKGGKLAGTFGRSSRRWSPTSHTVRRVTPDHPLLRFYLAPLHASGRSRTRKCRTPKRRLFSLAFG
ncbi:hypothetical protein KP509_19G073600 [Ceratopteris richardii]|uniref:Uncharacterized protein n=1 Tax=Ceratopteris richardii TaxID=49495 RepID=A0A8T2SLE9_CERRI|nr:hypothetical protein KP509_19G073600 [Ceratopteris richardii]